MAKLKQQEGVGLILPDTSSAAYKLLWRKLNAEQREMLTKRMRISIKSSNDQRLYVMPYARFHQHKYRWPDNALELSHVSLQVFARTGDDVWRFRNFHCAGLNDTHAALNVLAIKLLLEGSPNKFLQRGGPLIPHWPRINTRMFLSDMTLGETLAIDINPLKYLSEKPGGGR